MIWDRGTSIGRVVPSEGIMWIDNYQKEALIQIFQGKGVLGRGYTKCKYLKEDSEKFRAARVS